MANLKDKVAIVMGATREGNMGQAIAERFIREGAHVTVSGRSADGLNAFAAKHGASAAPCDISNKSAVFALFDTVMSAHGRVDIAVNASATGQISPIEDTPESEIDEMLAIIFKGGFFFMQAAIKAMRRGQGGAIINISSAVADIMFENHAAYMGAKAGLNHVTRAVANEYGKYGIRANTISPGFTVTPMVQNFLRPGTLDAFVKEYPLGRVTTVEDVANAAAFIASDECFMTGQTFHVTGGLTLRRNPTSAEIAAAVAAAASG